jgi:hypothetical protein
MARGSFQWRGESYRLDRSTWLFWGNARLILLPGKASEFRMTPDETLFIQLATQVGYEPGEDVEGPELISACQAYLEQNGHRIWTAQEAFKIVQDDAETDLATRLLDRLIYWFFVTKC